MAWIDAHAPGEPLSPWERYVVRRVLERDGQGHLWRTCLLLVPRQIGKTYVMRRLLLWRAVDGAAAFGAPQWVMNTAPSYRQAEELMEPWARELNVRVGGSLRARSHAVDWMTGAGEGGSSWRVRAMTRSALTGSSTTCVFADEVQDVPPEIMRRALVPTTSGPRVRDAQILLAGTGCKAGPAHAVSEESRVSRELQSRAMEGGDALLLEWSAPPECDPSDEMGWRWASPEWSEDRRRLMAEECSVAGFATEYLVQHEDPTGVGELRGEPLFTEDVWAGSRVPGLRPPVGGVLAAAVEDDFGRAGAVALVWRDADGRVCVWADARPLPECWAMVAGAPRVVVGLSLRTSPAALNVGGVGVGAREVGSALSVARGLIAAGSLRWDGDVLAEQGAAARVRLGANSVLALTAAATVLRAALFAVGDLVNGVVEAPAVF